MKWIALLPTLLLVACGCANTEVLESQQVTVTAPPRNVIEPVIDSTLIDVTTTTVKYY